MIPTEIQELINKQTTLIAQCDGELISLNKAMDNWLQQKRTAQAYIMALQAKYAKPTLAVWDADWKPAEVVKI